MGIAPNTPVQSDRPTLALHRDVMPNADRHVNKTNPPNKKNREPQTTYNHIRESMHDSPPPLSLFCPIILRLLAAENHSGVVSV